MENERRTTALPPKKRWSDKGRIGLLKERQEPRFNRANDTGTLDVPGVAELILVLRIVGYAKCNYCEN